MLRLTPILLAIAYAVVMYRISVWRTHRELDVKSTELADPVLKRMTDRLAAALDVARVPVYIYEIDPVNGLAAPDGAHLHHARILSQIPERRGLGRGNGQCDCP